MHSEAEILRETFGADAWREAVGALFDATGLCVSVLDRETGTVVHPTARCSYCDSLTGGAGSAHDSCFDEPPATSGSDLSRGVCMGGLPAYVSPVVVDGDHCCNLVVGGFVTSTRERKRLFEQLLGRGVSQSGAREIVREVPILTRREVEALVRMASIAATEVMRGVRERRAQERQARELAMFVGIAREFSELHLEGQELYDVVLERGRELLGADGGTLMLLRTGTEFLEVVAPREVRSRTGRAPLVRVGDGIAGRVAETARGLLVSGEADRTIAPGPRGGRGIKASVSVPISREGELLGVLNLNMSKGRRALSGEDLKLVERYAGMAAVAIDNARTHEGTERAMYELMHLGEFAKSLGAAADVDEIAQVCASILEKAFDFQVGGVVLTGWGRDQAIAVLQDDVAQAAIDQVLEDAAGRDLAAAPFHGMTLVTHRGHVVPDAPFDPDQWATLATELIVRDNVFGYIFIAATGEGRFDVNDRRLLEGLADHTAVAMERAATLERMRDDLAKMITALSVTLDASEHASPGHSDRVMDYAMSIGTEMGLDVEDIEVLRFAGLLHDVGKAGISEEILLKPTRLDDHEMNRVRLHAEAGASIVEQIDFLNSITPVVLHHHERWDGGGYPMGVAGEEIPLLARILAVADSFDAMTSERPYSHRLSYSEAKRELLASAGAQFDPKVVDAFLEAMDRRVLAGASGLFADLMTEEPQLPA